MAHVNAFMRTLDLRGAARTPVDGRHVWKLQAMLNVWLHSSDTPGDREPAPLLDTDGVAGVLTQRVVTQFQDTFQLRTDAIVGPPTWQELLEFDGNVRG